MGLNTIKITKTFYGNLVELSIPNDQEAYRLFRREYFDSAYDFDGVITDIHMTANQQREPFARGVLRRRDDWVNFVIPADVWLNHRVEIRDSKAVPMREGQLVKFEEYGGSNILRVYCVQNLFPVSD